jgi:hypothetical protein
VRSGFPSGVGRRGCIVVVAVIALVAAGCAAAPSGSVTRPATPSATTTASSAATPTDSPSAAPTFYLNTPTAPSTALPTAGVDPIPHVPAAPAGTWTSIHWIALPATPAFGARAATPTQLDVPSPTFQVFGWSRGFVGFTIQVNGTTDDGHPIPSTIVSSYSADGVHWHAGKKLDPMAAGSYGDLEVIRAVIEGPAGLLAVGWSGGCASEYLDSLWTSSDGITWNPVNVQRVFTGATSSIVHVSGGAAGYVAVAYHSTGVWTSKDGRTWQKVALGADPFKGALINDGAAISSGFVLAGTGGTPDCGVTVYDGSPPPPVFRTAAAWWSPDSTTWKRIPLPGAVARSEDQNLWALHLSDQGTLVVDDVMDAGRYAWVSHDGQSWAAIKLPADFDQRDFISGGQRNLVVETADLRIRTFDENFALVTVNQTGASPYGLYPNWVFGTYGLVALGPTGIVATNDDGTQLWFGLPS